MKLYEVLKKVCTGELANGTILTYAQKVTVATRLIAVENKKLVYVSDESAVYYDDKGKNRANGIVLPPIAYTNDWRVHEVPRKAMTLEEIERELGYTISIQTKEEE